MNETRTLTNSRTDSAQVRSPDVPDLALTKTHLVRLRRARGWDTTVGHLCSNILEILDSLKRAIGAQRENLIRSLGYQAARLDAELGKLKALAN